MILLKPGLYLITSFIALLVLAVPFFLVQASAPFWASAGIKVLTGTEWFPYEMLFGMLPAIIGSTWAILIALFIAIPCGVATAIVTTELVSSSLASATRMGMEVLAAIPSIVYGLIGLWLLLPLLQSSFDLLSGHSLLAAGLILALMILPLITLMSMDALRLVSNTQREAGMSLGLSWEALLFRVLLPQAWPAIRGGILLAMGRALGETMAVMLVVGSLDRMPEPIMNILQPAQTLTSRIGREIGEAAFGSIHFSALMACGLLLALIGLSISLFAHTRVVKA
ncbi:MAG: phosphate ABC transporter permease subunit PstC [Mariprofundus sp.]|nr:phosphate ABC transporter permease subunit PstC [Mariprofundus sp.]